VRSDRRTEASCLTPALLLDHPVLPWTSGRSNRGRRTEKQHRARIKNDRRRSSRPRTTGRRFRTCLRLRFDLGPSCRSDWPPAPRHRLCGGIPSIVMATLVHEVGHTMRQASGQP
jgi:hypothetical protein